MLWHWPRFEDPSLPTTHDPSYEGLATYFSGGMHAYQSPLVGASPLPTVPSRAIVLLSALSGNLGPGTSENDRAGRSKAFAVHETTSEAR